MLTVCVKYNKKIKIVMLQCQFIDNLCDNINIVCMLEVYLYIFYT